MAALDAWWAALAGRNTAPARVLCWGDSRTEGEGATTVANRWQDKLAASLRLAYPTLVGTNTTVHVPHNYSPVNYVSTTLATLGDWSAKTVGSSPNNFGVGTRVSVLNAAGHTATFKFTGTAFRLAYTKSNVASSFTYTVDAAAPVTVSWTTTTVSASNLVTVTGLSDAAHTIVVNWVSGTVYLEGAQQFKAEYSRGIHFYDGGHSGTRSGTTYGASRAYMTQSVASVNPHLVILGLLTNDYGGNIAPATYRTEMEANIAAIKAGCTTPPSIVLTMDWKRTGTYTYPFEDYLQALRDIAAADTSVQLFDLQAQFPVAPDNTLGYFRDDMVHETNAGQSRRAELLQALISPEPTTRLRVIRAGVTSSGSTRLRVLRAGVTTSTDVTANAGVPIQVDSRETVTLSAAASSGTPTAYAWTQTGGPTVTLIPSAAVARPTFKAPATDAGTTLTFALTVTAGGVTSTNPATNTVTVRPHIEWAYLDGVWVPLLTEVITDTPTTDTTTGTGTGTGDTTTTPVTPPPTPPATAAKLTPGAYASGVNLAGPDFDRNATAGTGYAATTYVDEILDRGSGVIRLPFLWERMQPTLGGALNTVELDHHQRIADAAQAAGAVLIPDLHNYGGRLGTAAGKIGAVDATTGAATGPTRAQFADFWSRYATALGEHPAIYAYDLMNEPKDMPTTGGYADGRAAWYAAAQAAITAIAAVDSKTRVVMSSYASSPLGSWGNGSPTFAAGTIGVANKNVVTHPAGQNMILWTSHFYYDTNGTYAQSYANAMAQVTYPTASDPNNAAVPFDDILMKARILSLRGWLSWLATNAADGYIGEWGIPRQDTGNASTQQQADAPKWAAIADRMFVEIKTWQAANPGRQVLATQWAAGTQWSTGYNLRYGPNDTTLASYLPGLVVERNQ